MPLTANSCCTQLAGSVGRVAPDSRSIPVPRVRAAAVGTGPGTGAGRTCPEPAGAAPPPQPASAAPAVSALAKASGPVTATTRRRIQPVGPLPGPPTARKRGRREHATPGAAADWALRWRRNYPVPAEAAAGPDRAGTGCLPRRD